MYEAMHHLPKDLQPTSKQALGSRWERIFQERKKGRQPWLDWSTSNHDFSDVS